MEYLMSVLLHAAVGSGKYHTNKKSWYLPGGNIYFLQKKERKKIYLLCLPEGEKSAFLQFLLNTKQYQPNTFNNN